MNFSKKLRNSISILFTIFIVSAIGCTSKSNSLIEVTSTNFGEVIQNDLSIIVFVPANCENCKDVIASFAVMKKEMPDLVVGKMDAQKNEQFLNEIRFRVEEGKPTIVFFSSGDVQDAMIGYQTTQELRELVTGVQEQLQLWKDVEDGIISFMDAFDFTLNDLQGNEITLSKINGLIVLDFWATWCPPCKAEIPYLVEFYQAYKNRGLKVLGVTAEKPDLVSSFITNFAAQGTDITYPILIDKDREISKMFGIRSIPTTFFIAPDGKLLKKEVGFTEEYVPDFRKIIEDNLPR